MSRFQNKAREIRIAQAMRESKIPARASAAASKATRARMKVRQHNRRERRRWIFFRARQKSKARAQSTQNRRRLFWEMPSPAKGRQQRRANNRFAKTVRSENVWR